MDMQVLFVNKSQAYEGSSVIVMCWESPSYGIKNPMVGGDIL